MDIRTRGGLKVTNVMPRNQTTAHWYPAESTATIKTSEGPSARIPPYDQVRVLRDTVLLLLLKAKAMAQEGMRILRAVPFVLDLPQQSGRDLHLENERLDR